MAISIVRKLERSEAIPARWWVQLAVFLETLNRRGTLLDARDWSVRVARERDVDAETISKAIDLSTDTVDAIANKKAREQRRKKWAQIREQQRRERPGFVRRGRAAVRKAMSRGRQWAARHQAAADERRAA